MCGILACLRAQQSQDKLRERLLKLSRRLRHRGPDWSGIHIQHHPSGDLSCFAHERLAIVDPISGAQPLFSADKNLCLVVNGEIYNHAALREKYAPDAKYETASDCEVIVHMYERMGTDLVKLLDGMFSFVVSNEKTGEFLAARDPIGVTPLYYGRGGDGSMWFASELKAIHQDCITFEQFPPGHYYDSKTDKFVSYWNPIYWNPEYIPPEAPLDLKAIHDTFVAAVSKRLMTDVPYGVLLSGGLDSSLVASVASRLVKEKLTALNMEESSISWWPLHSFSVGLKESPDLLAARKVAKFLGTRHHEFTFTVQDGIDALSDVIYHLETYDVTSVRASTPMYLMSRKIKAMGVKMVLSGEGADEVFGGYLYFHKAPNREEFQKETIRKLKALYMYDCLRANKATSAWGVEARVPFLDQAFLHVAMGMDPAHKLIGGTDADGRRKMEKWVMRKAFDTPDNPYLPDEVLWRQKEQFSDGVGYSWIDGLKEHAEKVITDAQFANAKHRFPDNTPTTKEGYLYRSIFETHFPERCAIETVPGGPSVACSTPVAIAWDEAFAKMADPSGRAVNVHVDAYKGP
eukprot:comp11789_c0_seq1/m.6393 comp11789_c0_seq1/g.6393  ORF comp11789_c0_seq1/g.6393 comp11789_c0_seq1/m.6393 type:complete len:575 (-) comp11789_c0_seq1:501-2225(-)